MQELITNSGRLRVFKFSRFNVSDYQNQVNNTFSAIDDDVDMHTKNKNDGHSSSDGDSEDEEKQKVYLLNKQKLMNCLFIKNIKIFLANAEDNGGRRRGKKRNLYKKN